MKVHAGTLRDYLRAAEEVIGDHSNSPPQLMPLVEQLDRFFHQEIFTCDVGRRAYDALLIMNAYSMLLSSIRQALSGHVVCVFPIARTALESACYAFLVSQSAENESIWANRHDSEQAGEACRKTFTARNAVRALKMISPEMSSFVDQIYSSFIDFGAHPNPKSIFDHLEQADDDNEGLARYELAGVYGPNSWNVNRALLACVEVGHAIVFLIAASSNDHPLMSWRLSNLQELFDSKNRMLETLIVEGEIKGLIFDTATPPN